MAIDSCNWMSDALATLGSRPLNRLVLPASHASGLYQVSGGTGAGTAATGPCANACNTQTQSGTILDQLEAGCRVLDIRPVLWNGSFHTGYYRTIGATRQGCIGPSLTQIYAQVAQFMRESNDLVILRFSGYENRDAALPGLSRALMRRLIGELINSMGGALYTSGQDESGLMARSLGDYLQAPGHLLAVFEALPPDLRQPGRGIHSCAPAPGPADLVITGGALACTSVSELAATQKSRLADPALDPGNLTLLGWHLRQSDAQFEACAQDLPGAASQLDLAAHANAALQATMLNWVADGTLTPATMPNLICVDALAGSCLQTALYLNACMGRMH